MCRHRREMKLGMVIDTAHTLDALFDVVSNKLVSLGKCSSLIFHINGSLQCGGIGNTQRLRSRCLVIGYTESVGQCEDGVGPAKVGLAKLSRVLRLFFGRQAFDILDDDIGGVHSSVSTLPYLLRGIKAENLSHVLPIVSLFLKTVGSRPCRVAMLVGIVGIHLGQVSRDYLNVSTCQHSAHLIGVLQFHAVVRQRVKIVIARHQAQRKH